MGVAAILFGFVFDSITLKRIDLLYENLVLISYLLIAALGIVFVHIYEDKLITKRRFSGIGSWAALPIQFAFGGLFSGFFIFYFRSSAASVSWLFLLLLISLLIGNEFFRKRYMKLNFQMGVLFVAVFSYAVLALPIITGKIGASIFILSGVLSIVFMLLLIRLLTYLMPHRIRANKKGLMTTIATIFVLMNVLYFTNVIPPIPLSLKEAGAYNYAERRGDEYILERGDRSWYASLLPYDELLLPAGDPVYFYTSVFAPTRLSTNIIHNWEMYDEENGWVDNSKVKYPINGGRDGGYRGFTISSKVEPGWWRVSVETERGQVLGRVKIKVVGVK